MKPEVQKARIENESPWNWTPHISLDELTD